MSGSKLTRFALMHSKMNGCLNDVDIKPHLVGKKTEWCLNSNKQSVKGYLCVCVWWIQTVHFKSPNFTSCVRQMNLLFNGVIGLSKVSGKAELQSVTCHLSQNSRPCNFCFWGVLRSASYHFAIWSRTEFCFAAPKRKLPELSNGIIGFTGPFLISEISDTKLLYTYLCWRVYVHYMNKLRQIWVLQHFTIN